MATLRARTRLFYENSYFQFALAALILVGFIQDVLESQLRPDQDSTPYKVFFWTEVVVSSLYTMELLCNMFVHSNDWFRPFYTKMQNWIDTAVVLASDISLVLSALGVGDGA